VKLNKMLENLEQLRVDEYHDMLSDNPTMASLEERLFVCFKGVVNDLRLARITLEEFNLIEAKVIRGKSPDLTETVKDLYNKLAVFKALLQKINTTTNGYQYKNYIEFQSVGIEIKKQFTLILNVYDLANKKKSTAIALKTAINNISSVINEMIDEYNSGAPEQKKIAIHLDGRL